MAQNSNQFNITNEKGALTLVPNINVIDALIDKDESATLIPGDAVKIKDIAGKLKIEKATGSTDAIFGFLPFDVRTSEFVANDAVKVALRDCVMVMEASAAIAVGASLEIDTTTMKVATATGVNTVIGTAFKKAVVDGDLIDVFIGTPATIPTI